MANAAKYSRGACGHMLKHYERAKDENGEYIRFGNQDIDTSRSHLNYNLAPERPGSQYSFIKQRCSEVYCLNRSDVNVLCSWVVTAPKGLDLADHDRFFRKAYDVLAEKYGEENVVSAYVHKDESGQPHMHFAFVPVTWDAKKERYTVKAKDVLSKAELKKFHPWLSDVMQQEFGRDIGIETGELGTRGNLTMEQYKTIQEANKEAEEAKIEAVKLKEQLEITKEEMAAVKKETTEAWQQVSTANALVVQLSDRVENLEKEIEEGRRALTLQEQEHDRNERMILEQEEVKRLIQNDDEYQQEAKDLNRTVDLMETWAEALPLTPKLFRATNDAKAWLRTVQEALRELSNVVRRMINRLQIYEQRNDVDVQLSKPAQQRMTSLSEVIRDAALKAGMQEAPRDQGRQADNKGRSDER